MAITKLQSESLNLADDFTFTGTVAGAGGANTPAFRVIGSGGQVLSDATRTKVIYDTVTFDTNSAFDTSNYRFVVPSGHAGKYNFYSRFRYGGTNCSEIGLYFYKNGVEVSNQYYYSGSLSTNLYSSLNYYTYVMAYSGILSVGDYIEIFVYFNNSSTGSHSIQTHNVTGEFVGYKIIE